MTKQTRTKITKEQAAEIVGLTVGWLATLRSRGRGGPPSHKLGRQVYYIREEVEAWRDANTTSTAGESVLVVEIKTMAMGCRPDGSKYITVNGVEHAVDSTTGAVLLAQKKPTTRGTR